MNRFSFVAMFINPRPLKRSSFFQLRYSFKNERIALRHTGTESFPAAIEGEQTKGGHPSSQSQFL